MDSAEIGQIRFSARSEFSESATYTDITLPRKVGFVYKPGFHAQRGRGVPVVYSTGGLNKMITTTLAVLALAGGISSGNIPSGPSWQTDYAQAMTRASAERKPMAVFIGHGAD